MRSNLSFVMTKESAWEMLQICCLFLINFQDFLVLSSPRETIDLFRPFLVFLKTLKHENDDEECTAELITY